MPTDDSPARVSFCASAFNITSSDWVCPLKRPVSAWQPQLPPGWTLKDIGDRRELRNARGRLVTEISYLQRKGKREPIGIEQHVFKYHITIQYLGD